MKMQLKEMEIGFTYHTSDEALLLLSFSHSVMSVSLRPHGLQHARPGVPVHYQLPELTQTHIH